MAYLEYLVDIIWNVAPKVVSGLNRETSGFRGCCANGSQWKPMRYGRVVVNRTINQMNHYVWKEVYTSATFSCQEVLSYLHTSITKGIEHVNCMSWVAIVFFWVKTFGLCVYCNYQQQHYLVRYCCY